MDKVLRFYASDVGEIADEESLAKVGLDTEDKINAAFNGDLQLKEVWLKPAKGQVKLDFDRLCQAYGVKTGNMADIEFIQPYARIESIVEKWNGFNYKPEIDPILQNMDTNIIAFLNAQILAYMYPSVANRPDFSQALSEQQASSAPEKSA